MSEAKPPQQEPANEIVFVDKNIDLIDAMLVLFMSCAILIFIFWLSSRALRSTVFETIPDFVAGAYGGVWSAGIAGGVGIGGAILKSLTTSSRTINYLKVVLLTTVFLISTIFIIIGVSITIEKFRLPNVEFPPGSTRINLSSAIASRPFEIKSVEGAAPGGLRMNGRFQLENGRISGVLESWSVVFRQGYSPREDWDAPIRVAIFLCMRPSLTNSPLSARIPVRENRENSYEISGSLYSGEPNMNFTIDIPDEFRLNDAILCGFATNRLGGTMMIF